MSQRLPGPANRWFGMVHLPEIRRDFRAFAHRLWQTHGDAVAYHVLGQKVYHFATPELAHEILVAKSKAFHKPKNQKRVFGRVLGEVSFITDGDRWTRRRRLLAPLFHPKVIEQYRSVVLRQARRAFGRLSPGEVNISHSMSDISLMSVAEALFGSAVLDVADEFRRRSAIQQEILARQFTSPVVLPLRIPTRANRQVRSNMRFYHDLVGRMIDERRRTVNEAGDLLTALMAAVDTDDGSRLDDTQVRNEALTMLLAGNDTTAAALSWSAYLLAKHLDVQQQLVREVRQVVDANGDLPVDAAGQLEFAGQVFQEAMRLYPPAVAIGRHAVESVPIGDTPVPRGALVFVLVYTMHRDARWFSDPERFDPGRFSAPREGSIPEHAYLPFGLGPRACIGRRFSMMEGPLVLAELVRQFQIRLSDGSEPELETQISLHPRGGVPLWLTARPEGAEVDR